MVEESGLFHIQYFQSLGESDAAAVVVLGDFYEVRGIGLFGSAEASARLFCKGYAFGLTAAYIGAFVFCDKGKNLKDNVCNKSANKVVRLFSGVKERHIQNDDIGADFVSDSAPF